MNTKYLCKIISMVIALMLVPAEIAAVEQKWTCKHTFLPAHDKEVLCVAFNPAGTLFATGSMDETVKICDAETGLPLKTCKKEGDDSRVTSVAFNDDGTLLASGYYRGIKIWNAKTGELVAELKEHTSEVSSLCFHHKYKELLVSGSHDNKVKIWKTDTKKCVRTLTGWGDDILCVDLSPDGTKLAIGSKSPAKPLTIFDVSQEDPSQWKEIRSKAEIAFHTVESLCFSLDGNKIVLSSPSIYIVDVLKGEAEEIRDAESGWTISGASVSFCKDDKFLVYVIIVSDKTSHNLCIDSIMG